MPKGVHKGKRGRKPSALPPELRATLGPAPLGQPLKLARWFTDAIAVLTQLVLEGKPFAKLLETVRASAGAAGRIIPVDIIQEARGILAGDAKDVMSNTAHVVKPTKRAEDTVVRAASKAVRREVE